jgi:hypothetical protein
MHICMPNEAQMTVWYLATAVSQEDALDDMHSLDGTPSGLTTYEYRGLSAPPVSVQPHFHNVNFKISAHRKVRHDTAQLRSPVTLRSPVDKFRTSV